MTRSKNTLRNMTDLGVSVYLTWLLRVIVRLAGGLAV